MHYQEPYAHFEEKRDYPRVQIKSPVVIYHENDALDAEIYDISSDGLQVRCDRKTFQIIHPTGVFIRKNNAPVINIDFQIVMKDKRSRISVKCLMYYFVLVPDAGERDVAFGLRFIMPDDHVKTAIKSFIEQAINPDEDVVFAIVTDTQSVTAVSSDNMPAAEQLKENLLTLLQNQDEAKVDGVVDENNLLAAVQSLLKKTDDLEKRLSCIEQNLKRQ